MKVYLIKASAKGPYKEYKKSMGAPPQNIFSVAAATPEGIGIEMTDETVDMKVNYRSSADVIGIFMSTPDAMHAYKIAKKFKAKGKTVVFGGLHSSFMPDEVLQHGDAVLIGEVEGIWEELLEDFRCGIVKPRYQRDTAFDLAELKPFPTHIIPLEKYDYLWSVTVSRGCPYRCGFCTVPGFFKGQRYRPIEKVVEEIKNSGAEWLELHADNLMVNRKYVEALFKALIPLNVKWMAETSINLAKDEELLALAAKSGLRYVLLGLETPSKQALKESGKNFIKTEQVKERIDLFNKYGIEVDSAFIFGFDGQDKTIFRQTYDYCKDLGLQSLHSVILIPFPGSPVYEQYEKEGRILTRDWSQYDGSHVVFEPKGMPVEELEIGADWFHHLVPKLQVSLEDKEQGKSFAAQSIRQNKRTTGNDERQTKTEARAVAVKKTRSDTNKAIKWKSMLALVLAAIGTVKGWLFIWGVFCLFWAVVNIRAQEAYFVERIERSQSPVIYWIIIAVWLLLSATYFAIDPLIKSFMTNWII